MSIYSTDFVFQMEKSGSDERVEIWVQAVPGHVGNAAEGDADDYYGTFLPPPVADPNATRAAVFVRSDRAAKDGQRYTEPLLVLTGEEYHSANFVDLMAKLQRLID